MPQEKRDSDTSTAKQAPQRQQQPQQSQQQQNIPYFDNSRFGTLPAKLRSSSARGGSASPPAQRQQRAAADAPVDAPAGPSSSTSWHWSEERLKAQHAPVVEDVYARQPPRADEGGNQ
jgi:hypothetical protein